MTINENTVKSETKLRPRKKNPWYKDVDFLQLLSLAAIPILFVFIFNYLPMGGIIIAFKNFKYNLGIFGSEWIGFKNFEKFVTSNTFATLVRNTVGNNLLFIFTGMIAAILVAILLYHITSRRATKTFQTIIIIPHFISWVMVSYIAYTLFVPGSGIMDNICAALHLPKIAWYGTPAVWPAVLCLFNIWKHFGMDSVIYYAALMGVDDSIIEAAKVDGATRFQIMIKILLPQLMPVIIILGIMKFGNIFRGDFGLFYNVPRDTGALYATTDVLDTYIFRMTRVIGNMGVGAAAGVLQSFVGLICVVTVNKIVNKISPDSGLF